MTGRGRSPAGRSWARGNDGADELTGTELGDLLDGGSGTDTGYGKGGNDDCISIEHGDC